MPSLDKTILLLSTLLAVSCTAPSGTDAPRTLSAEQEELYRSWHTGQFYYKVKPFGIFLVNRYDTLQEEFIRDQGLLTEFGVQWLNDSMYQLRFLQLVENPQGLDMPQGIDTLLKTCTMTQVSDTVYVEKAYSNLSSSYIYTKYRRPKQVQTSGVPAQK